MKLIGAGLPRTGTLTQKVALEMLGLGPCYHMVSVLGDLDQARLWDRALAGEEILDEILGGYGSIVDWPGGYFYKELADTYPDAKVLLSVRDAEKWEHSMRNTVWAVRNGDSLMRLLSDAQAHVDPNWAAFVGMLDSLLWKNRGTFASAHDTPDQLIEGMHRHNKAVEAAIPADRLLRWSVTEGWGPLCEFLELPVPDAPFPRVNDSEEFVVRIIDSALAVLNKWHAEQKQEAVTD